jgi:ligand-binding sensor domain-containing protein/putative methionine-R-sulfoxide reductase with GAF domain
MLPVDSCAQNLQHYAAGLSNISFQHLTTANGLSYGGIRDLCIDKSGNLWIATGNGLNMFNGRSVTKYYAADYPELVSNSLIALTCDENNRVWVLTEQRTVLMIDENRRMHKIVLGRGHKYFKIRALISASSYNPILFTENGFFQLNSFEVSKTDSLGQNEFTPFYIKGFDSLQPRKFKHVFRFDEKRYFFSQDTVMFILNFKTKKVEQATKIPRGNLLIKWDEQTVLLSNTGEKKLQLLNIYTGVTTFFNEALKDQFGKAINDYTLYAEKISNSRYLLTTARSGMYIYERSTNELYNYRHNPSDPSSISSDNVFNIAFGNNGWAFLVTSPNGVSYFNTREVIGTQTVFTDANGRVYDGFIGCIATEDNNTYYLGTNSGLIEWKRNVNISRFLSFKNGTSSLLENENIQTLLFDSKGQLWVSTISKGILVLDKNKNLLRYFKNNTEAPGSVRFKRAYSLQEDSKGFMWAGGENGMCRININNFSVDYLRNTPLGQFENNFVSPIFFPDADNIWFAITDGGARHYNFVTGKLEAFTKDDKLSSNYIFSIQTDKDSNVYIGSDAGVDILLRNGNVKTITTKDGLLIPRAEALLPDKNGCMWIGNDIGLACYSTIDSSLLVFDERYGLSIYGYRVNAYYRNSAGEFVFGTPKGLQYFFPEALLTKKINLNALVSGIETKDISTTVTNTVAYNLASDDNYVTFSFSTVDYSSHLNTFYQYKLENNDADWTTVTNQNSVHYSSLPPGKYIFRLRVSSNKKDWQEASNSITINIAKPYWKTWWFRALGILMGLAVIGYVINYFRQKQKQKQNELETELVITYFASQINKHTDIDALLWDVAKNCISRLHFEDCIIYMLDKERNMLVQKAAYGPKNPVAFDIKAPIEIPVGRGIVGTVALTGVAEIVNNTAADERYIVDDEVRYSEITVPIILDSRVVGVIDSEHQRRNFFTERHLKILNTIAALCAAQMQLVQSEEDKKKAEIELLRNKQKALESRLQSLRLQMNPHFLFNALNSVQQMILANEEMVATRYLSRFSKLLRAILVHSDKETITLKEELEILQLYVELESIRFKESFTYSITCDEDIDVDEVKIPTLLVQPFVENAIWHGLMHKEGERRLQVYFAEKGEWLQCVVEDNGVGREKAQQVKAISSSGAKHQSKGIAVSMERLKAMRSTAGDEGYIVFTDLYTENGAATGTRIEINFPIIN